MKKIFFVIKRVVIALCILYSINLIVSKTGVILPINVVSIGIVSVLGLPSVVALLVLYNIIM